MRVHELKTSSRWFQDVRVGRKKWEIRKNDRGFGIGDLLMLREWSETAGDYTGQWCLAQILTVWNALPAGLEDGYVVLDIGLRKLAVA